VISKELLKMSIVPVQKIDSNDLNLADIFKDFYIVPSFQREFVWGEQEVEQLLIDVLNEFPLKNEKQSAEYFIGSIVVALGSDGTFELIDGQQRMTTAFIFFCATRDYLAQINGTIPSTLEKQIADSDIDEMGNEQHRYRVVLQYEDSHDVLKHLAESQQPRKLRLPKTRSVANILDAHQTIINFHKREFGNNEAEVRRFYAYFINRVKLIRINTGSIAHALKVFETVNDRGIGLDPMDLLKNLMFMRASKSQYDDLKDQWKRLIDTLYKAREKPLRFLRYFIFSQYSVERLKEDEIYVWFSKNEEVCGYGKAPLQFVEQLCEAASSYVHFVSGRNSDGSPNRYLINIGYLSGATRQHAILLLAGREMEPNAFVELSRQLENLFFAYTITREPTRDFERRFALWAPELRPVRTKAELDLFIAKNISPGKNRLAKRFELAFQELRASGIQKFRLRYVLGKLTQYVNEQAYGETETELGRFIEARDVEHILPQTPTSEVVDSFDRPEDIDSYIERLGNLTLLEFSINRHLGNKNFSEKRAAYAKSQFLLTRSIEEDVKLGNSKLTKAVDGLMQFEKWDSTDIELRQLMLTDLARKVWEMPLPSRNIEEA
jgi:hypothetical protein